MKVIKVGSSSQARIAQACDRCRSKKIKCDGIRPCCSQCANVGFECKTSDKLSRRAFPRGYTESLEERVRLLEAEVRELKILLDEKDEKIDILSKMHSHRPSHSSTSPTPSMDSREESSPPKDDVFRVQASPLLLESENADSYFMGASSGRAFVGMLITYIHSTITNFISKMPSSSRYRRRESHVQPSTQKLSSMCGATPPLALRTVYHALNAFRLVFSLISVSRSFGRNGRHCFPFSINQISCAYTRSTYRIRRR